MNFRISKFSFGRIACLTALLIGANAFIAHAQDGCPNPPPNVEATPQPTPTFAPPHWDSGLGIGVVPDADGNPATTSGPPPTGGQPIIDGRMIAPQDQRVATPAPAKVQVGKLLSCAVEEATDSDHWMQTDGRECSPDPEGTSDDGVNYSWSANGGSFTTATNGTSATWQAPTTPGRYTITCTINDTPTAADDPDTDEIETGDRNDAPISRSCTVAVYSFSLRFVDSVVAVGNVNNAGHQATYEITASDGTDPVADVDVDKPGILAGTGLGAGNSITAYCTKGAAKTNGLGKATGTFTSGNRTAATTIVYEGATASINQVWNELSDEEAWNYDPYFYYDEASTLTYTMSYTRDNVDIGISGHSLEPEVREINGYEWNPLIGEDWDEDGFPDGDYESVSYSATDADSTGFDLWNGLVEWGPVIEDNGSYDVDQTIYWHDDFITDYVYFWMYDNDSFGPDGDI